MYLWFKLLHVFFVISWFAGLFYLPRIYVNLAQLEPGSVEYIRLTDMSRRLYRFMSPLGWGTLIFGAAIGFVNNWWGNGLLLLAYQLYCGLLLRRFQNGSNVYSHRWYRVFNELPVLMMVAALYMVVFKPF